MFYNVRVLISAASLQILHSNYKQRLDKVFLTVERSSHVYSKQQKSNSSLIMISQNGILTDKNCGNYFDVWNWRETTMFV